LVDVCRYVYCEGSHEWLAVPLGTLVWCSCTGAAFSWWRGFVQRLSGRTGRLFCSLLHGPVLGCGRHSLRGMCPVRASHVFLFPVLHCTPWWKTVRLGGCGCTSWRRLVYALVEDGVHLGERRCTPWRKTVCVSSGCAGAVLVSLAADGDG